jgi:hypothetical protein
MMEYKLAINIILFILICYVILRFIGKRIRMSYMTQSNSNPAPVEPFTLSNSADAELKYIQNRTTTAGITQIQGARKTESALPLKEYCIKAAYGAATTGNYVHLDMIKHVLSRGCRFLDFDVFYVKENNLFLPKVGFSSDVNNYFIESKNTLLLDDVFNTIATHAFSQTSPNRSDPLFINMRIKSNDSAIYSAVAKSIDAKLKSVSYQNKITSDTPFDDLMGKVIVAVDKTIRRDYKRSAACETDDVSCYDLSNYVNIESGSENLNLFRYTDLLSQTANPSLIKDDNLRTTAKTITMAVPDVVATAANPKIDDFIVKYGCQIVACRFHILDDNLQRYEMMFDNSSAGCVPLSVVIPYMVRLNEA